MRMRRVCAWLPVSLRDMRRLTQTYRSEPAEIVDRRPMANTHRIGDEIRSLSRFQVAQRTGFMKILKKYKRWTKDRELSALFKEEISSRPDSLFQLDLSFLLDQYIDVLGALRSVFNTADSQVTQNGHIDHASSAARISRAIEGGDELDFDVALTTVPLGPRGSKAVYWVHLDHLVEVQVFLLHHMRLYDGGRAPTRNGSVSTTPRRRRSSAANLDRSLGNEDDVGLVLLDHAEAFAMKQNSSTISSSEDTPGSLGTRAVGNVRCLHSGKAAVVLCPGVSLQSQSSSGTKVVETGRKSLKRIFEPSLGPENGKHSEHVNGSIEDDEASIRQWFAENASTKPLAGVVSKRTRFMGLNNSINGGLWATFDRDICMKSTLHEDLGSEDWITEARSKSFKFPHAILEVRREGIVASNLLQELTRSHLIERVRGFSLETHAIWTCCKPPAMSSPTWIPLLDQDIRKLPEPVKRKRRNKRANIAECQALPSPPHTSTSNTSYDGQSSPQRARIEDSSATSVHEFVNPPQLQAFRKKSRVPSSNYTQPLHGADIEPEVQPRYWNEYDNPEDEETGYYIYVDPDAPVNYPGQEFVDLCVRVISKLFGKPSTSYPASIDDIEEGDTDDGNDSGDDSPLLAPGNYGTLPPPLHRPAAEGFLGSILQAFRGPRDEGETLQERRLLLHELESREHKVEMTKQRFYTTSLLTAIVIDIILGIMTTTSRKKERGVVDGVVLFGTICTLLLVMVAVMSMKTRRERLGWVHQGAVLSLAGAVVAVDVLLLLWVVRI